MAYSFSRQDFPQDFRFGVATAAYQIEGSRFGGCGPSHWDTFGQTPGNVARAATGDIACDHYNRYEEDLDLVRAGGFEIYRFSTSWARVMPDGKTVSAEGLDFYDRLVDAMLARGLAPYLTLYHWDLPAALADLGGWMNRDTALRFADLTRAVIGRLGDRVEAVATLNEPWCVAWLGHFTGEHAPGIRDRRAAARAMHHALLAHGTGMEVLREAGQRNAGIVLNLTYAAPATEAEADLAAAHRLDGIHNRWFLDAVFKGRYPADILEGFAPHMPESFEADMAAISAPIDWLGINYYTRALVTAAPDQAWPSIGAADGPLPKTDMGWEIYPEGLGMLLERVRDDYSGMLPIVVTENGMAGDDVLVDGACEDPVRERYIDSHLGHVRAAIARGVPVKGYIAWSLLDNYEWAFGYDKRFGLVYVDYDTQARHPKTSFTAFRDALCAQ